MSDWQNAGSQYAYPDGPYAHGGGDAPRTYSAAGSRLSREEVLKLYEMKLDALRDNLRRRDRANWFYLALAFVALPGLVLLLTQLDAAAALTDLTKALLVMVVGALGLPACMAWRNLQRYGQDRHEKMVKSIRKMEAQFGFGLAPSGAFWYSPLDQDDHPADGIKAERSRLFKGREAVLFNVWEQWLPFMVGCSFAVVACCVYHELFWSVCGSISNYVISWMPSYY